MARPTCPECGQVYKPSVGHCRGGRYEGCCRSFASNRGADAHRVGDFDHRRCLTDEELASAGWFRDANGYWVSPRDLAQRQRLARRQQEGTAPMVATTTGASLAPSTHQSRGGPHENAGDAGQHDPTKEEQ